MNSFIYFLFFCFAFLWGNVSQANELDSDSIELNYGNWKTICVKAPEDSKRIWKCQAVHTVYTEDKQQIMVMVVDYDSDKRKYTANIVAPLGTLLSEGYQMTLNKRVLFTKLSVKTCTGQGCLVELSLSNDLLKTFRAASSEGLLKTKWFNESPLEIKFSLKGFSLSVKETESRNNLLK